MSDATGGGWPDDAGSGRAFVLGLDGVPWDELGRWIDNGHLPNFARLRAEGTSGHLDSTRPPMTALAWPSIATGVRPDKHGVYDFRRLTESYTHRVNTRRDVARPALWDLVSPAVVANVPMTYPAAPIDGTMITGMMTPELNEQFTHPPAFRDELLEQIPDYEIGLEWAQYEGREAEFVDDLGAMVDARQSLMHLLMERHGFDWRLFFFVYTAPDRLQHLRWEESVLLEHYRHLDRILGEVMTYVTEAEATLYVVSDHGFGPVSTCISANRLLEREGLLTRRVDDGTRGLLERLGLTKDTVLSGLERVGIDQRTLLDRVPKSIVDRAAARIPGEHVLYDVDYSATEAFVHGDGCVYVNRTDRFDCGTVTPGEVGRVKRRVVDAFEGLTSPLTDDCPVEVRDGSDLFPTDDRAPDLVVRGVDGHHVVSDLHEDVFSEPVATNASHEPEGVFFAWGTSIRSEATVDGASVFDVAPTVLHGVGEPVPAAADGRVLDVFDPDSAPARRDVSVAGSDRPVADDADTAGDDFGAVEDRLRGLGYME